MAWEDIAYITGQDYKGNDIVVTIRDTVGVPMFDYFKGAGNFVSLSYKSGGKMDTFFTSGATIQFWSEGADLSYLYTNKLYGYQVEIKHSVWGVIFLGFLNTQQFTTKFSKQNEKIKMMVNDGLANLKRESFIEGEITEPFNYPNITLFEIVRTCLSNLNITKVLFYGDLYVYDETIPNFGSLFEQLRADKSNFVDEDNVSMSKREVLETILKPLNARISLVNNIAIISQSYLTGASSLVHHYWLYNIDGTLERDFEIDNKLEFKTDYLYLNTSQEYSMVGGLNRVVINASPYPDIKKVVPFEDREYFEFPTDGTYPYVYYGYEDIGTPGGSDEGWLMRRYPNENVWHKHYFLGPATNANFIEWKNASSTDIINNAEVNKPAFELWGLECNTDDNPSFTPTTIFAFKTGYLYLNDATQGVSIVFSTNVQSGESEDFDDDLLRYEFTVMVTITDKNGTTKYGTLVGLNEYSEQSMEYIISEWTTNSANAWQSLVVKGSEMFNTEKKTAITLWAQTNEEGIVEVHFSQGFNYTNINPIFRACPNAVYDHVFISEFEAFLNHIEVDDTDYEVEGRLDERFADDLTVKINQTTKRTGDLLDRGKLVISSHSIEFWYFGEEGDTVLQSLYDCLLRLYTSELGHTYKRIKAIIKTEKMFTFMDDFNNTLSPISVLIDPHFPGKYFLNISGTLDLRNLKYTGQFEEIRGLMDTIL